MVVDGRVIAHVPQNADGDEALWKVRHFEDGDLEDLDETEFLRASSAYEKDLREPLNGFPYDDEIVAMQIAQNKSHVEGGGRGEDEGKGESNGKGKRKRKRDGQGMQREAERTREREKEGDGDGPAEGSGSRKECGADDKKRIEETETDDPNVNGEGAVLPAPPDTSHLAEHWELRVDYNLMRYYYVDHR